MNVVGRTSRVIPLGVKLDECPVCQAIAAHAVARRVRWFHILSLQLIRLGSDHVLVCGNCGLETPIADDLVAESIKSGSMRLERDRPSVEAALTARTGAGGRDGLPPISSPRLDPAAARSNAEHRLQEVVPVRAPDRQAIYDRAWPALAAVLAIAVFGGGGFLAMQGAGITLAGPQGTPYSANPSTAPTASPSPQPTPLPTEGPFEVSFNRWKGLYIAHVQTCYTGGACDLDSPVEFDGTLEPLAAAATRIGELYRDHHSVNMGAVSNCRQEHGSSFTLVASIASEIEVIRALKPSEAMPKWRPALAVAFEPCNSTDPDPQASSAALRDSLADARAQLVKIRKLIRAKNWSGARDASATLTELAATIMRTSARDFPLFDESAWAASRGAGWDLMRVSGLIQVKRLASAKSTSGLIDATAKSIDKIKLPEP